MLSLKNIALQKCSRDCKTHTNLKMAVMQLGYFVVKLKMGQTNDMRSYL